MLPLESVPNVSEGRDLAVVASLGAAFAGSGARLLDTHVDADHHRSVFTLVGDDRALEDGLVAGVEAARRVVDLRAHDGVHPRVGAADVVPVVPLDSGDLDRAEAVARAVARRVGEELELPVFLYGSLGGGLRPAFFRRGGPDELQRRIDAGELSPAYGPARLDSRAGAVLVGVRRPLLAFNLELHGTLDVAREIAAAVRHSSGGLPGVQALGLRASRRDGAGVDERHRPRRDRAARDGAANRRRGGGAGRACRSRRARRAAPARLRGGGCLGRWGALARSERTAFRPRLRSTRPLGPCTSRSSTQTASSSGICRVEWPDA